MANAREGAVERSLPGRRMPSDLVVFDKTTAAANT